MAAAENHAFGTEYSIPGLHAAVAAAISHVPRETAILDLGCGSGALLRRLKAEGFTNLTGIDWSLPSRVEDGITYHQADLTQPTAALGQQFGLILAVEVVEHMPNVGLLLQGMRNHLADQGEILITTPNIASLNQRLKFLVTGRLTHFDASGDPTHYLPVLPDSWSRMLKLYKLEEARRWTYPNSNAVNGVNPVWGVLAKALSPLLHNPLPGECLFMLLKATDRDEAWNDAREVHTY